MTTVIAFFGLAQRGNSPESLGAALELNLQRKNQLLIKVCQVRKDRLAVIAEIAQEVEALNTLERQFDERRQSAEDDAA